MPDPRPKKNVPHDLKSLCRAYTVQSVQVLAAYATAAETEPDIRIRAIQMLLDRGYGKPESTTKHTGADGESAIEITIRNIIESKKK